MKDSARNRITKNGPYLVSGDLPLAQVNIGTNAQGESVRWEWGRKFQDQARYALCRCGGSANKPYCDGTHTKIDFDGTETASSARHCPNDILGCPGDGSHRRYRKAFRDSCLKIGAAQTSAGRTLRCGCRRDCRVARAVMPPGMSGVMRRSPVDANLWRS